MTIHKRQQPTTEHAPVTAGEQVRPRATADSSNFDALVAEVEQGQRELKRRLGSVATNVPPVLPKSAGGYWQELRLGPDAHIGMVSYDHQSGGWA